MATKTTTTAKPADKPADKPATVPTFQFRQTEAPAAKAVSGRGRKPNPEVVAFIQSLEPLPLIEDTTSTDGWFEADAPDVSAYVNLLRIAGNKMGVSFQVRHDVEITDDDTLNPGTVKFRKITRRTRKSKTAK